MTAAAAGHVTTPAPRDVAGYDRARAAGVLPPVSSSPPPVAVRPTAHRTVADLGLTVAATVIAVVVTVLLTAEDGQLPWASVVVVLVVGLAGMTAIGLAARRWGRAQMAELGHGYTTATFQMGGFWIARPPDRPWTLNQIHWDFDGTWVLRPDGSVISPPSAGIDPPGLYPSPNAPQAFELWTGAQWSGYFRSPPT